MHAGAEGYERGVAPEQAGARRSGAVRRAAVLPSGGLFAAFLPLPFQMFIAAFIAFYANANLPISVGLVWISNPITIPPLFYGTYLLGAWMLDTPPTELEIELSLEWAMTELSNIWEPLFVGSLTTGITLGVASYFLIHLVWRMHVWDNWKKRKLRQTENNSPDQ